MGPCVVSSFVHSNTTGKILLCTGAVRVWFDVIRRFDRFAHKFLFFGILALQQSPSCGEVT